MPKRKQPSTEIPAGWGFRAVVEDVEVEPSSGQLYESAPGRMAHHAHTPIFQQFVTATFVEQIEMFEESGDDVHLWRAWRTARCMGEIPAPLLARLLPHLDRIAAKAARPINPKRASQRERRDHMIRTYNALADMADNPKFPAWKRTRTEILRIIAKQHGTTEGAVNQVIINYRKNNGSE